MVESSSQIKDRLLAIGIEPKTVDNILKNKAVVARFEEVLDIAGIKECAKEKGALLYGLTTKGKGLIKENLEIFVACLVQDKWTRMPQLDAGLDYVLQKTRNEGKGYIVADMADFEKETGVGIVVTQEQIDGFVDEIFKKHEAEIAEKKHDFNFATFLQTLRKDHKWADGGAVRNTIEAKKLALLGEPPKDEGGRKKKGKQSAEDKKKAKEEKKEETKEEPTIDIKQLIGRDVDVGNSPEVLAQHREATGNKIRTRFPPEPNGYLHIGHAKAIRFNFEVAKQYEGTTYLRFDDTNPDKENQEYIDHIKDIVSWLGYTPAKTTASSDYFQELYDHAVKLIKKGLAYVCFQNKEDMPLFRNEKRNPPTRDNSIEWNLREFEKMRTGRYAEGVATLRCKIDMQHDNANMRDFVAYRVRFTAHPHSGDKWCIYPTYDFTHCLVDSIENISHSLCTLEFEIRRESYYWLLKACEVYQPFVWEYSRLNITNTVLSKRKIEELITNKHVTGWNDPRLHTIQGLKRRGYTPSIINDFCEAIGVSRAGNENFTSHKRLEHQARLELDATAPRTFGVLDPVLLKVENFEDVAETSIKAPLFPAKKDCDKSQTYTVTSEIFVERDDFSEETKKGFFGIMPEQVVCLRYGPFVKMTKVEKDASGQVTCVHVRVIKDHTAKVKGVIHWVSAQHALPCVVNQYDVLLDVENVGAVSKKEGKPWLSYVNQDSLKEHKNARVWDLHADAKPYDRFQFERVGYFCVDEESKSPAKNGMIVFNSIVALKESAAKKTHGA